MEKPVNYTQVSDLYDKVDISEFKWQNWSGRIIMGKKM